jgi:phospholipid-binding lipoprotein MlaA
MKFLLSIFLVVLSVSCGKAGAAEEVYLLDDSFYEDAPAGESAPDPFEHFNRTMFTFNDYAYTWVMEPTAAAYSKVLPQDVRKAADNFCYNLQEPVRFFNALLQLRFKDAGTVLIRFAVNTVGGVAGLADVAGDEFGFAPVEAGLGETLENWGVPDGFYLVAPFLGASTLRELTGTVVDGLSMTPYYFLADTWKEGFGIYIGRRVNYLSLHLGDYETMKEFAIDPYKALRDGYFQSRTQYRKHSKPSAHDKL